MKDSKGKDLGEGSQASALRFSMHCIEHVDFQDEGQAFPFTGHERLLEMILVILSLAPLVAKAL